MKFCKIIFIFLLSAFSGVVFSASTNHGSWYSTQEKDPFTDEITYEIFAFSSTSSRRFSFVGFRCDIDNDESTFMFTFKAESVIDSPNSRVTVELRVDSNEPIKVYGKMFTNSYDSGFVPIFLLKQFSLLDQMKSGNTMMVRISNLDHRNIYTFSISLNGLTSAFGVFPADCLN